MPRRREKKKYVFEYKASTNDYLLALAYHPSFSKLLLPTNKNYGIVLEWLISNEDFLKNEDNSLPSIKELSQNLNLDRTKVSKYLKDIYDDIFSLNEKKPNLFMREGQYLCDLSFSYLNSRAYFSMGLDVIPRVNDSLSFDFIKPKNGGSMFYVEDVSHELDGANHKISIYLTSDFPNKYLKLLKEKAYLRHYITFQEFLEPMSSEEVERLVKWYREL